MIEFVGLVPFFRLITHRVAIETMRFEPNPNRFILEQLYLAFMVSWVKCNLTLIPGYKVYITF